MPFNILGKPSLWKRFREWLQRDVEIQIWDIHKGLTKETDLKQIHIKGVIFAEDVLSAEGVLRTRKIDTHRDSFTVTLNPAFVNVLCPFREKRTKQQLIKQENGTYLLTIEGVANHE